MHGTAAQVKTYQDWTNDELRAALEEGLTDPENLVEYGNGRKIVDSLLREWMRRDFDGALAWYEKQESTALKVRLTEVIADGWPASEFRRGIDFILNHRKLFPDSAGWPIMNKSLEQSALAGPAAVEELLRMMGEKGLHFRNSARVEFPKGFDFPSLLASEEFHKFQSREGASKITDAWLASDRDQAFDWLLENQGVEALRGLQGLGLRWDKEVQKWLGEKVEQSTPARQAEFFESFSFIWMTDPTSAALFAKGVQNQDLLDRIGLMGFHSAFIGNAHGTVSLLEILGPPARRIEILEKALPDPRYLKESKDIEMNPADETYLRNTLSGWNATDSQIDSIISRFKP